MEAFTGDLGQMFFFHGKRSLVEDVHIQILDYVRGGNVAEQGDFAADIVV